MTRIMTLVFVTAASAPVFARVWFFFTGAGSGEEFVSGVERGLALLFSLLALREAWRVSRPSGAGSSVVGVGPSMWPFWLCLPMAAYLALYSFQAYSGLYLGDHDFTNLSAALNQSARGTGVLPTPYVYGGPGDTFLGHHFAPGLLLFVPAYWATHWLALVPGTAVAPTHFLYAVLLWAAFVGGVFLWADYLRRELPEPFASGATAALALAFPLWRIAGSFHFEVLVLPASALICGAPAGREGRWRFWAGVVLLLAVKEDMAAYLFCFALFLWTVEGARRRAQLLLAVCVVYGGLALGVLSFLSPGETGVAWGAYWRDVWGTTRVAAPGFALLLSLGLIPVLAGRAFWLALAPVMLVHALSFHPWHQSFTGHYIYAVLPALLFTFIQGMRRLSAWRAGRLLLFASLTLVCLRAAADRETPLRPAPASAELPALRVLIDAIPSGACVQAAIPASPHLRLDLRAFPLLPPQSHPARLHRAPFLDPAFFSQDCAVWYVLYNPDDPRPPYYIEEHLRTLNDFHGRRGEPRVAGDWRLYAWNPSDL